MLRYRPIFFAGEGMKKIMDFYGLNRVRYPDFSNEEEGQLEDFDALQSDFIAVGNDLKGALKSYERPHRRS